MKKRSASNHLGYRTRSPATKRMWRWPGLPSGTTRTSPSTMYTCWSTCQSHGSWLFPVFHVDHLSTPSAASRSADTPLSTLTPYISSSGLSNLALIGEARLPRRNAPSAAEDGGFPATKRRGVMVTAAATVNIFAGVKIDDGRWPILSELSYSCGKT